MYNSEISMVELKISSLLSELAKTRPRKLQKVENPRKLIVVSLPTNLSSFTTLDCFCVSCNERLGNMCMACELEKHEF